MNLRIAAESDAQPRWDDYVSRHPLATHCHRWGWKQVIESAFGHRTFYLIADDDGQVVGVQPLAWQKSMLFGSFLTSLPFLNAGGALADSAEIERLLVERAIAIARECGARYLQLRYRGECHLDLPISQRKVAAVRAIVPDTDAIWKSLDSNNRRKVNKAMKSGLRAAPEGADALRDFYELYARNMRDLGTPVYGREFFAEVLRVFPDDSQIIMVRREREPVAAALLLSFRDTVEATWMCSNWDFLSLQPNMLLYWANIQYASERGFRWLDLGRSTRESGTHKFKQLWDTEDVALPWAHWSADGKSAGDLDPANPKYQMAVNIWKRLPLGISKLIGPHIVKNLP